MSTNDTLRGLLADSQNALQHLLHNVKASGKRVELGLAKVVADDVIDRIDAALAEPVSGGVVLPERQRVKADANYNWNIGYNQALDDVAALNGGAVAGQADRDPFGLAGCVEELLFIDEPPYFECAKGLAIRCACRDCITSRALAALSNYRATGKPLESERGGE